MLRRLAQLEGPLVLALCAVAGLAPTPWLSFPAAVVLLVVMPGRRLLRLLPPMVSTRGWGWSAFAASLVLMPVPLSWAWSVSNDRLVVLAVAVAINLLLMILGRGRPVAPPPPPMFESSGGRWVFIALIGWTTACVAGTFWLIAVDGRIADVPAHDFVKHHAVMLSLEQHPLPLHNIFYAAESDTPYYYYEYHYLMPAALRTIGGDRVSILFAFGFTAAAVAAMLMTMVYLLARDLMGTMRGALVATACVCVVGGWDIVPVLLRAVSGGSMVVTLDSWCPVAWRIHNLMTMYVWCPQHVSALLTLLVCGRFLHYAPRVRWWIVVAPIAGASIFGSSVYLAMTFFPAAAVWVFLQWRSAVREDPAIGRRFLGGVGLIAVVGLALMAVQAWHYHLINQRYAGGLTMDWERFPLALFGKIVGPGALANLLDAPWIALIDFGLPGLACLLVTRRAWSRLWTDPGMRLLLIAAVLGAGAMFTVHSNINPIDYSFRAAIMPAMIVAAMLVGILAEGRHARTWVRGGAGWIVGLGMIPGLAVGLYEAPVTAGRRLIEHDRRHPDAGAIRFLRVHTPIDAVVQGDPTTRFTLPQLIDRQMGVLDRRNAHVMVFQPVDPARMDRAMRDVEGAFFSSSGRKACVLLSRWGVEYVLAGEAERSRFGAMPQFDDRQWFDPVYRDESSTVYRVLECADDSQVGSPD